MMDKVMLSHLIFAKESLWTVLAFKWLLRLREQEIRKLWVWFGGHADRFERFVTQWVWRCFSKFDFIPKPLPQSSHLNFFS